MSAKKKTGRTGYNFRILWEAVAEARARLQALDDAEARGFYRPMHGNGKTGDIPALSIMPGPTCPGRACATCLIGGCYACKNAFRAGYKYVPDPETGRVNSVLRAWAEMTALAMDRPEIFRDCLYKDLEALQAAGVELVRIHAAGDFFNLMYARIWYQAAQDFPALRFLAFTKSWETAEALPFYKLANFSLVLSAWPGLEIPEALRANYRVSWCQDGTETRIPADAMHCPGDCDTCGLCWYLAETGRDVWFSKH